MAGQGPQERTGKDYLWRRPPSPHWRLKFQYPTAGLQAFATEIWADKARQNGVRIVWRNGDAEPRDDTGGPLIHLPVRAVEDRSLQITDYDVARQLTADFRHTHEQILTLWSLSRKPGNGGVRRPPIMTPGTREVLGDSTIEAATETKIVSIHPDGRVTERENSQGWEFVMRESALTPPQRRALAEGATETRKALRKDIDAEIVDKYAATLNAKGDAGLVTGALLRFKEDTGKTIAQASRADVVDFIEAELGRRATEGRPLAG